MTTQRLSDLDAEDQISVLISPQDFCSGNLDDFARLIPVNQSAKEAFDEVATNIQRDPSTLAHAGRYLYITPTVVNTPHPSPRSFSPYMSPSPDTAADMDLKLSKPSYSGHFRFSLDILPKDWRYGWIVGAGRPDKPDYGVDFLITGNAARDRVKGRHARVYIDSKTRVMVLKDISRRPGGAVTLNGKNTGHNGLPLSTVQQSISIGNLLFSLEFEQSPAVRERHLVALGELLATSTISYSTPVPTISPTPSHMHVHIGGYWIQTPQAHGAFGIVMPAIKLHTIEGFAAKRIKRTRGNLHSVRTELELMEVIGKHPHVCRLKDELYTDGDRGSMGQKPVNELYMILEPLADRTLADYIGAGLDYRLRLHAIYHLAQGLRHIHSKGVIHRDIKPSNLLIVEQPFCLVVADFGHSTIETQSTDHLKGTLEYLPPEIVALKYQTLARHHWTPAADVFASGLVACELLFHTFPRNSKRMIDQAVHSKILNGMEAAVRPETSPYLSLFKELLSWNYNDRPTMEAVCLHGPWSADIIETDSDSTKRKEPAPQNTDANKKTRR